MPTLLVDVSEETYKELQAAQRSLNKYRETTEADVIVSAIACFWQRLREDSTVETRGCYHEDSNV